MNRRLALKGIAGIIGSAMAPAIIPIKNIMPVKRIITPMDSLVSIPYGLNLNAVWWDDVEGGPEPHPFQFVTVKQKDIIDGFRVVFGNAGEVRVIDSNGFDVPLINGHLNG